MCLGIYIPADAPKLTKEQISYAFDRNPHGAGIMYTIGDGPVVIQKGFMTRETLWEAYQDIPEGADVGLHVRYATHGVIDEGCCHPFPVRSATKAMRHKHTVCHQGVLHNGIIGYAGPTKRDAQYSDSMNYIAHVMFPLREHLDDKIVKEVISQSICGSRILIFRKGKEPIMLGRWVQNDGKWYSNSGFMSSTRFNLVSGRKLIDDCRKAYLPVKYNPLVGMTEEDIDALYNMEHEDMGF